MSVTSSRTPAMVENSCSAVDLRRRDGGSLERRQQDAPQRVAESDAEAALERLGDQELAVGPRARHDLQLGQLDQFLPIPLDHGVPRNLPGWSVRRQAGFDQDAAAERPEQARAAR